MSGHRHRRRLLHEDDVFKALAMGAPYVKAVCMGRALMIPGMVGKNIGEWMENGDLPKTVSKFGSQARGDLRILRGAEGKYGKEIKEIPIGRHRPLHLRPEVQARACSS